MSRRQGVIIASVMCFTALASGQPFAQETRAAREGQPPYPRITCEELKALIDAKKTDDIVIVDNQPEESYDEGHIPGAVSFPWTDEIKPPVRLPRNKTLVMYCPCLEEEDSIDMANKLKRFGYRDFKLVKGGWFRWEELKYPIGKKKPVE